MSNSYKLNSMEAEEPRGPRRRSGSIKSLLPSWLKRGVRAALKAQPSDGGETLKEKVRRVVLNDLNAYLPPSRLEISKNTTFREPDDSCVFRDFFARFNHLVDDQASAYVIEQLEKDYPALSSVAVKARAYLKACDSLNPPLDSAFRRAYFQNIPLMNSRKSYELLNYKATLPRVGIMYYPNPEARDFLIDALEGKYNVDDMEFGQLLSRVWQGRDCDFHLYQECLQEEIERSLAKLPSEFWRYFPDKNWFVDEVRQHTLYQMAFKKLLDEKHWDLIIVGAMETSMGHVLFDSFQGTRPPVLYFNHGILCGEPLENLFLAADKYIATGKVTERYFLNLGIEQKQILKLGSTYRENFPTREGLACEYKHVRDALGIPENSPAIVYGLTMDLYLYKKRTCEELTGLMIRAFEELVTAQGVKNPYLFLKYHPSPRSDRYFSFSRQQMPLERFYNRLKPLGYEVRLIKDLNPYLKAADCFIAHESGTVLTALEEGCPTLSLLYHQGRGQPLLGWETYKNATSHKLLQDHDEPSTIARALKEIIECPKSLVHSEGLRTWNGLFDCGRTESLVRLIATIEECLQIKC